MIPLLKKTENLAPLRPDRAALHEIACAYAEDRFRHKGECDPTWLVAAGSEVSWVETTFDGPASKDRAVFFIRNALVVSRAQAYSYISEAYVGNIVGMTEAERKKWLAFATEHGVAALPERMREDVLMVFTHDRAGGASVSRYLVTIRRGGKGLNFLGPRADEPIDEAKGFGGRMFNLFEPEKPMEFGNEA